MAEFIIVGSSGAFQLESAANYSRRVTHEGGQTVYYSTSTRVSSTINDGSLTTGGQFTFTGRRFFITQSGTGTQGSSASLRLDDVPITGEGLTARIVLNVLDYGADSTGQTDSTTAIMSAVSALPQTGEYRGGDIFFPRGLYLVASQLTLDDMQSIRFVGEGSQTAKQSTTLKFSGSSGSFISARSSFGFQLRNLRIWPSNSSFTGDLIDLDWSSSNSDVQYFRMENCEVGRHDEVNNARTLLRMNKTIISTVRDSHFNYGTVAIRMGDTQYCNAVQVTGCTFNFQATTQITASADEGCSITGCTFEALSNGKAGAFLHSGANWSVGMYITGNWFGDAAGTPGNWLTVRPLGGAIIGNRFSNPGVGATDSCIEVLDGSEGCLIAGNRFEGPVGINFPTAYAFGTAFIANDVASTTGIRNAANASGLIVLANAGAGTTKNSIDVISGVYGLGVGTTDAQMPVDVDGDVRLRASRAVRFGGTASGDYNASITNPNTGVVAVNKLGVANAAAATVPGAVVKKIQVYDQTGTAIGYVPVYDAIT